MAAGAARALAEAGTAPMLKLRLVKVPSAAIVGIYGAAHIMPERALWAHPSMYEALMRIAPHVVFSDVFRSPESSLRAMQEKTGVQPPSYSFHGEGMAVDLSVAESMKRGGFRTKMALDAFMLAHGFPPFNIKLGATGQESWHWSYLPDFDSAGQRNTAAASEAWMRREHADVYGHMTALGCQAALAKLGFYHGALDGKFGPQSVSALSMFQRALKIASYARIKGDRGYEEGDAGPVTERVLAYCAAERVVEAAGVVA